MNDEHQKWIDAYIDGAASPKIVAKLDRLLQEDANLRVQFLESASMIADLPSVLGEGGAKEVLPISSVAGRKKFGRRMAVAAAAVIGIGVFLFAHYSPSKKTNPGSLILVEGWAHFDEKKLQVGDRCEPPGRIVAGTDADVVLQYPDGSLLTLEGGSALRLDEGEGKEVFLEHGSLLADMKPQPVGKEMKMDTPNSRVTVLGTRYRLATTIIEDLLEVEHGKVRVLEKGTNKELVATQL